MKTDKGTDDAQLKITNSIMYDEEKQAELLAKSSSSSRDLDKNGKIRRSMRDSITDICDDVEPEMFCDT